MKIILPGGSGQVGALLAHALHAGGHDVVILSRRADGSAVSRTVAWDGATLGDWAAEIDGADVVINLAGRSVDCRYTPANRRAIMQSRVDSTQIVGRAIAQATNPPHTWLQASTATIYAHRYDAPNDDLTGILGGNEPNVPGSWRFSLDVARAWEGTLAAADTPHTRKVALRAAMIMSPDPGGVFSVLLRLVRLGLGGRAGDGRQYVSWIHGDDFVRAVCHLIDQPALTGAINLAAPGPLPYAEFMATLRRAWGMPFGLPATRWMLEIGAFFLRTETELILKSRRVTPGRLLASGFTFDYPKWDGAAANLVARVRAAG